MVAQYSNNKITEIWMCALNYNGCIVTYNNGKKEAISTDIVKQILQGYKRWLEDNGSLTQLPKGLKIDDRLTTYFGTLGIMQIQFI